MTQIRLLAVLAILILSVSACSISANVTDIADLGVLFEDDFTGDEIGVRPSKWEYIGSEENSTIKVVADSELDSKRAVRIISPEVPENGNFTLLANLSVPHPHNPSIIEVEYKFKLEDDYGRPYVRIEGGNDQLLQWDVSQLQFRFPSSRDTRDFMTNVQQDTWYHVRVVLDRENTTATLYFDGAEEPDVTVALENSVDTWRDASLSFKIDTHSQSSQTYSIGEVIVRALQ